MRTTPLASIHELPPDRLVGRCYYCKALVFSTEMCTANSEEEIALCLISHAAEQPGPAQLWYMQRRKQEASAPTLARLI